REGVPGAGGLHDVVGASEEPEPGALAPVAGVLLAQHGIGGERIGVDGRRVEVEWLHRAPCNCLDCFGYHHGMADESKAESAEQELIARYFKPLATHPGAFGLVDDAAAIAPPAGLRLRRKARGG